MKLIRSYKMQQAFWALFNDLYVLIKLKNYKLYDKMFLKLPQNANNTQDAFWTGKYYSPSPGIVKHYT